MAEKPKRKKKKRKKLPSDARLMMALVLHEPRITGEGLRSKLERLLAEYEGDADRAADDLLRRFREPSANST